MKRKLLAFLLAVTMVMGMIPAVSAATSGSCGPNLRWSYDSATATLTISGSGEMYDYLDSDASKRVPWREIRFDIQKIVVNNGVTNLGEYAFQDFKLLQSVKLPDSLTRIKEGAFYGCYSLTDIDLPDTMVEIGKEVFYGCHALAKINFPDSITSIGMSAFENTGLTSVRIPAGVAELRSNVFTNCESLTEVTFHDGIEIINVGAFQGCFSLSKVELPESLTLLGSSAFAGTGLTRIEIPDTVLKIGGSCFRGCEYLREIKMGSDIKEIGSYAFEGVPLKEIELPEKLEELGDYAFNFCPLSTIEIPRFVNRMGHRVFNGCQELVEIRFTGRAPYFTEDALASLVADVYYPEGYSSWTEDAMQNAGGTINWIPYQTDLPEPPDQHDHEFCDWYTVKEPTMTEKGLEERVCSLCGLTETQEMPRIPLPFDDVKSSDYFFEPVLWAVENGITSGVSATRFAPSDPCTRAQVVTFLWRAAGEPQPASNKNPFRDVKSTAYYYDAVLWAVEQGITTGMSATSFGPNSPCTRGQVVTFLHRAAGAPEPESAKNPFSDVKKTGFYYDAVLWAVENGITTGTSATRFSPGQTCTRGQVVTFLYRAD